MTNRREFVQLAGAAALAAGTPLSALAERYQHLPKRPIPKTHELLPIIGYGNAGVFADGNMELSRELVEILIERGGKYIDVSGNGRNTIGKIMRERGAQSDLFLGTYIAGENLTSMRAEIGQLLEEQGRGSLDLVLTRAPVDFGRRRDEYQALKDEGLTRYVGVGRPNQRFYPAMAQLMNEGALDIVQVNYSMMEPEAEQEFLPLAMDKEIGVVINRPFINGDYFGIVRGKELPEWAAEFDCESWAQFSLKYILSHPAVNCVLTETSNPEHAIDNLGAGYGRLPDEDTRDRMKALIRGWM